MTELPLRCRSQQMQFNKTLETSRMSRAAQPGEFMSSGRMKQHGVVVFPYYHDRLPCDPQNFFCVYGRHDYRWGDTVAKTEENVFAIIDEMIRAVQCAYDEAMEHWRNLPSCVKQAHALRSLTTLPSAPLLGATSYASSTGGGDSQVRVPALRKAATPAPPTLFRASTRTQQRAAVRTVHAKLTPARSFWREDEEAVMNSLIQQWYPPHNRPKCRIVFDIVASRKTLGESPTESGPYLLGQRVFGYVKAAYAMEVMTTFVGISDSNVTLVGKDLLYPYRMTGGGGGTTTYDSDRHHFFLRRFTSSQSTATSGRASADGLGSNYFGGMTNVLSNVDNLIAGSIPFPRFVPSPPSNVDKVDNVRLLVCFPPINTKEK